MTMTGQKRHLFWENNEERAWQWAKDLAKRKNSQIKEPAVVGAIIDLGYCFDLTDSTYLQELKAAYEAMVTVYKESGIELPKNTSIGNSTDLLIRKLDCAVVQTALTYNQDANAHPYDSVKGVFWEGQELYPNAGFREKNHIQICVCNPNCIKGVIFFLEVSIRIILTHNIKRQNMDKKKNENFFLKLIKIKKEILIVYKMEET